MRLSTAPPIRPSRLRTLWVVCATWLITRGSRNGRPSLAPPRGPGSRLEPERLVRGGYAFAAALARTARDRSGREAIVRRVAADVGVVERHEPRPEEVGIRKTTADAVLGDGVAGHGAVVQHQRWCRSAFDAEVEVGDPAPDAGVSDGVVERAVLRDDSLV